MSKAKTPCDICRLRKIQHALKVLGLDGDTLFANIRNEIERGNLKAARMNLDFVDTILEAK